MITSLEGSGIEVVKVSDAETEQVMRMADMTGTWVELMAVEEAKRRADAIENLTPINVATNNKSREELNEDYKKLSPVEKDGRVIKFYNSAFKKIYKDGGLFAQVVPQLDDILKQSVLAYSEADNQGGMVRPDGTVHKAHDNVESFDNYVGKVGINDSEYYVRITVQSNKSGENGTHSFFVTNVNVYKKTTKSQTIPLTLRGTTNSDGIVDTKLQQFFDYANGKLNNPEFHIVYHGSGAKFDAFDHSHMGEGEGNQSYGWGTYVTEVEEVGKTYANVGDYRYEQLRVHIKATDGYLRDASEMLDEAIAKGDEKEIAKAKQTIVKLEQRRAEMQEEMNSINPTRHLYTIEIPDDNGSNYLNHDKVVPSKEIARVKQRLFDILSQGDYKGAERELKEELNGVFAPGLEGDILYNNVSAYLGGDKYASQFFNEMGYVGIKYPTNYMSGGNTKGQSNYVIFNEADANIVDRVEFLRTPQGVVYGWTDGKKVYLTEDGMNPETPIHEYTHIWARAMKEKNAKGWQSVKDLLRDTPMWNEVMNDANYADIRENEDAVASEVLSRLSGKENAKRMESEARKMIDEAKGIMAKAEAVTLVERMRKALNEFWSWVGKNLFDIKSFGSIEEVTDRVLYDLVNNTELETSEGVIEKQVAEGEDVKYSLRSDDGLSNPDKVIAREAYERMVASGRYQFTEAMQDSMMGLKLLYKAILGKKMQVENIPDFENAYIAENLMSSQNAAMQQEYYIKFMKPLVKAINALGGKDNAKRQAIIDYLMAKHGLERNQVMAQRDAKAVADEAVIKNV